MTFGDIGIISEDGSFRFLLNICLDRHHPINPLDFPEGITPLSIPLIDIEQQSEFVGESYISSASVKKSLHGGDSSGLIFETTASEGAILMMPLGSNSTQVTCKGRFRDYIRSHAESWYKYANNHRRWDVENGHLLLVTGYDKTKAWGIATFSNSTSQEVLHFRPTETSNVGRTYGWACSGTAQVRNGPDARQIEALRGDDPSQAGIEYENQTLFVRTMAVELQDDVWKKLAFDFGELPIDNTLPTETSPLPSPFLLASSPAISQKSDTQSSDRTALNPAASLTSLAGHPSKGISEMLLRHAPDARMAITDDEDWSSLLTEDDKILPTTEELNKRIMKNFAVREEEGVVFLEKLMGTVSDATHVENLVDVSSPGSEQNREEENDGEDQRTSVEKDYEISLERVKKTLSPSRTYKMDDVLLHAVEIVKTYPNDLPFLREAVEQALLLDEILTDHPDLMEYEDNQMYAELATDSFNIIYLCIDKNMAIILDQGEEVPLQMKKASTNLGSYLVNIVNFIRQFAVKEPSERRHINQDIMTINEYREQLCIFLKEFGICDISNIRQTYERIIEEKKKPLSRSKKGKSPKSTENNVLPGKPSDLMIMKGGDRSYQMEPIREWITGEKRGVIYHSDAEDKESVSEENSKEDNNLVTKDQKMTSVGNSGTMRAERRFTDHLKSWRNGEDEKRQKKPSPTRRKALTFDHLQHGGLKQGPRRNYEAKRHTLDGRPTVPPPYMAVRSMSNDQGQQSESPPLPSPVDNSRNEGYEEREKIRSSASTIDRGAPPSYTYPM